MELDNIPPSGNTATSFDNTQTEIAWTSVKSLPMDIPIPPSSLPGLSERPNDTEVELMQGLSLANNPYLAAHMSLKDAISGFPAHLQEFTPKQLQHQYKALRGFWHHLSTTYDGEWENVPKPEGWENMMQSINVLADMHYKEIMKEVSSLQADHQFSPPLFPVHVGDILEEGEFSTTLMDKYK